LREEYKAAIAKNAAKIRYFNDQYWLLQNAPFFYKEVERYLVNAYSRPPADTSELEKLLAEYVSDQSVRLRVLDGIHQAHP
jgi:hypothetical protein